MKKSNPEQLGSDQTLQVVVTNSVTSLNICADGPVAIDLCGTLLPLYGTCTTSNNTPSSTTILKVTVDPLVTNYQWQYQLNGAGNWLTLGTGASASAPGGFSWPEQ